MFNQIEFAISEDQTSATINGWNYEAFQVNANDNCEESCCFEFCGDECLLIGYCSEHDRKDGKNVSWKGVK